MNSISTLITEYLDSCRTQKCLDEKTLKAYRIDLRQFSDFISDSTQIEVISDITSEILPNPPNKHASYVFRPYSPKQSREYRSNARHPTREQTRWHSNAGVLLWPNFQTARFPKPLHIPW